MNGDKNLAVAMLAEEDKTREQASKSRQQRDRRAREDHWRWRFQIAEQLAANLDPARFGVKGIYLFGSTKNATAGPQSDIDLIVHFTGSQAQREALVLWLEGWSLTPSLPVM